MSVGLLSVGCFLVFYSAPLQCEVPKGSAVTTMPFISDRRDVYVIGTESTLLSKTDAPTKTGQKSFVDGKLLLPSRKARWKKFSAVTSGNSSSRYVKSLDMSPFTVLGLSWLVLYGGVFVQRELCIMYAVSYP